MVNSCANLLYNPRTGLGSVIESYCGRILRICVFQHAENAGQFEKCLVKIYKFFSQGICSIGFDAERAKRGRELFEKIGADFLTIPVEGNRIDAMRLQPQDLERLIKSFGGSWQRCESRDGQAVIAISPPENPTSEWLELEKVFFKLGWPKQEGLFVTCPCADVVSDKNHLFIQVNSASTSYVMMRKRIGLFLGCKQTVVVFDPPGTGKSTGVATEGSYLGAVKGVYDKLAANYSPNNVWVSGACLGSMSAAYLRSRIADINLLLENAFVDLREDFVKPQGQLNYWFVRRYWPALFRKDQEESGFNIAAMWNMRPQSEIGKILVISVRNDQRVSQEVAKKLCAQASRINAKVCHIPYHSPNKDPHFSRFDDMPDVPRKVLHCIFS